MRLPVPDPGPDAAVAFVREHLADLTCDTPAASPSFRGGQTAADAALAALDVTNYARRRNEVWPPERRGASRMSPWIRHGLLSLPALWEHVADAPSRDRTKYRDELAWQEYARHVYARVGPALADDLRARPPRPPAVWEDPWPRDMACMDATVSELHEDGWLVNQTRMWLSSQWTVRAGARWRDGEDAFFTHLLDGSRAANRLGWQWTVGSGTGKAYGFSRYQVEKRAPELCAGCVLDADCPIQDWPAKRSGAGPSGAEQRAERIEPPPALRADDDPAATAGPSSSPEGEPPIDAVWLTAESLGDDDPALAAHPGAPAVFVFDEPLLRRLRLSGKRLVFLTETLADLATRRPVELYRGRVPDELGDRRLAVTFAPVPGFRRFAARLEPAEIHPWPWLFRPRGGRLQSYTAWRKGMPSTPEAPHVGARP